MRNTATKNSLSHRLAYSSWDFQQSLSALTFLLEECDFEEKYSKLDLRKFRCFETTAIVSFSRPFKVGRGQKPLELASLGIELCEQEEEIKRKVLTLRDKIVAHSDEEKMEYVLTSPQPIGDSDAGLPIEVFRETLYLDKDEYLRLEQLLLRIMRAIAMRKFDIFQSDPDGFAQKKQPDTE